MSDKLKFKVGGYPPLTAISGRRSKWEDLHSALDDVEIGVWARTFVPDEKIAKNMLQAARKYLKPRKISVAYAIEKKDTTAILWIKKIDKSGVA